MEIFNDRKYVGWYRRGLVYGIILGVLTTEFVHAILRLIQGD